MKRNQEKHEGESVEGHRGSEPMETGPGRKPRMGRDVDTATRQQREEPELTHRPYQRLCK